MPTSALAPPAPRAPNKPPRPPEWGSRINARRTEAASRFHAAEPRHEDVEKHEVIKLPAETCQEAFRRIEEIDRHDGGFLGPVLAEYFCKMLPRRLAHFRLIVHNGNPHPSRLLLLSSRILVQPVNV